MATSMTGVGVAEIKNAGRTVTIEIRSVNNRFLDVSCRLPQSISKFEQDVRQMVRTAITRGKIYVSLTVQDESAQCIPFEVNPEATKRIRTALESLCELAGIKEPPGLEHYLHFTEVFQVADASRSAESLWQHIRQGIENALKDLVGMRKREGDILTQELIARIKTMEGMVAHIQKTTKTNVKDTFSKLQSRVHQLLADTEIDEERLRSEIVLMADKLDISEECVRLQSHQKLFREILNKEPIVGKKLTFLLQEMNREANTISSKSLNAAVSHSIVEMKDQIEQLREQVQNLE